MEEMRRRNQELRRQVDVLKNERPKASASQINQEEQVQEDEKGDKVDHVIVEHQRTMWAREIEWATLNNVPVVVFPIQIEQEMPPKQSNPIMEEIKLLENWFQVIEHKVRKKNNRKAHYDIERVYRQLIDQAFIFRWN